MTEATARAAVALIEDDLKTLLPDPLGEGWVACTGGGVYLLTGPDSAPVMDLMRDPGAKR